MSDINVRSSTQKIYVDPASSSVAVINAGPVGPAGPPGVTATTTDTRLEILAGGCTGQVLMKLSDSDYDFAWVTLP